MRFTLKKGLVATTLALAVGSFSTAQAADLIQFDPDGSAAANGTLSVTTFDWTVDSALADNSVASPGSFNLYFHATLGGLSGLRANNTIGALPAPTGLNGSFEITVIGGFTESLSLIGTTAPSLVSDGGDGQGIGGNDIYKQVQSISLSFPTGGTSFMTMFYDDLTNLDGVQSNPLTGLGYDDGTVILTAALSSATGTFAATQEFRDVNNDGDFDPGIDVALGVLLDGVSPDDWGGQLTVIGDGSTSLVSDVLTRDTSFFITALTQILQDVDFTTQTKLPFITSEPSKSFDTDGTDTGGSTLTLAGGGIALGTINGGFLAGAGTDVLFQADGSNSFKAAAVPEPGILGLLGLGLMGLALSRRKVGT